MATADSVKAKIQSLIASANVATGENSSNLADAVAKLIAGFGNGENSGGSATDPGQTQFHMGTYFTAERCGDDIVFSTPGGVSYFVMFMNDKATTGTGLAYFTAIVAMKEAEFVYIASSNTVATSSTAAQAYPTGEPTMNYFPGISFGQDSVTFIAFKPLSNYCKLPQPGKTYIWLAW